VRGYLTDKQKLFTLGNVSGGYDSAMPDDTTITVGAVLTRTSERVVTITGLKAPDGYPVTSLPTTQNIKINPVALANETAVTFTSAVCGTSTNDAVGTTVKTAEGQLVVPLVVKATTFAFNGSVGTDYENAPNGPLSNYFTFNGENKAHLTSTSEITSAILVDTNRIDVVFAAPVLGASTTNIVIAEEGKFGSYTGTPTLSVHAPEVAAETITIGTSGAGLQVENDDTIVIEMTVPGSATFASQSILDRYWLTPTGKKQLFTISPMEGIKGYDPAMAQTGATITRDNNTKITISGLAPLQGIMSAQKITLNPIVFADASVPTTVTAISTLASSGNSAILAPGSQGTPVSGAFTGTSVTGLTSGTYIMKSGSTWYQLATGTAAIPTTAVASLEAAIITSTSTTTGVTGLTAGVEYDIYRVITPVTGTAASRTLKVGASDSTGITGVTANTIVYLTKLVGADVITVTSAGNVSNAVQLLFFTGAATTASSAAPWMQALSDSTKNWVSTTQTSPLVNGNYFRMGSRHWLYKMRVINKGGGTPSLVLNQVDKFATLRGMSAVGINLSLEVTRGLILEEASRGTTAMASDGKITVTGLTVSGTTKGYVVRTRIWTSATAFTSGWQPINNGVVLTGLTPDGTVFERDTGSSTSRQSNAGSLTGDSGGQWATTPTWAVFYLVVNHY
jgi:hypothetical protein